jgi:hypothetical protein
MAWFGYCFKDGSAQSTNNISRDTGIVRRTARRPHILHVNISVTIHLRLGLCVLLLIFYHRNLSRGADDIFTAERTITLWFYNAQSGNKNCNVYDSLKVWLYWNLNKYYSLVTDHILKIWMTKIINFYQLPKCKRNIRWFGFKFETDRM